MPVMHKIKLGLLAVLFVLPVHADHYFVASEGSDSNDGSQEHPWQHIQFALDQITGSMSNAHTIHIAAGFYDENLILDGDDCYESLVGSGAAGTIVDAGNRERCLVQYGQSTNNEISGLTFQNGSRMSPGAPSAGVTLMGHNTDLHHCIIRWNTGLYQSGVFVMGDNIIRDCEICENISDDMNGHTSGIYIGSDPGVHVHDNYIHHNQCTNSYAAGGMMVFFNDDVQIERNLFQQNYSQTGPAAIYVKYGQPVIRSNVIRNNLSDDGPVLRFEDCNPVFENNLVADNSSVAAALITGGHAASGSARFSLNTIVSDSIGIIWRDCPAPKHQARIIDSILYCTGDSIQLSDTDLNLSYTCLSDELWTGPGVIHDDPSFMLFGSDYHLSPGSPCIDAGDPESDFCNEPWPYGCRVNMGAYGNTAEAAFSSVLTCTPTCPPSPTPSPTQIDSPTPTQTPPTVPSATPTVLPTPSPGITPSPTQTDGSLTHILTLNDTFLCGGEQLLLEQVIDNRGPTVACIQYICLEAYGSFYFYPDWGTDLSGIDRTIENGARFQESILDLMLPGNVPVSGPFFFYGLLMDPQKNVPLTNLQTIAFFFIL